MVPPPPPTHPTYFNPLPSHEGRPEDDLHAVGGGIISIHSPHTRGDSATA